MSRTRTNPRKGDTIIVTNTESPFVGLVGVIQSEHIFKGRGLVFKVTETRDDGSAGVTVDFSRGEVAIRDTVGVPEDLDLRNLRTERMAEEAKRNATWREEYRQKEMAKFVVKTIEIEQAVKLEAVVDTREYEWGTNLRIDPKIDAYEHFRELINVTEYHNEQAPKVTVNWSAVGSVTPAQAIKFAQALLEAAERAKGMEDAQIAARPEVFDALVTAAAKTEI